MFDSKGRKESVWVKQVHLNDLDQACNTTQQQNVFDSKPFHNSTGNNADDTSVRVDDADSDDTAGGNDEGD